MRGHYQGMPLADLARHYLPPATHARTAATTLRWIEQELAVVAKRHGHHAHARLIRLNLQAVATGAAPSLEDFRREADPHGFYREEELIALFREVHPEGVSPRNNRAIRLRERQLDALKRLEGLACTSPVRDDSLDAWLPDNIAKQLERAGYFTINDVIALFGRRGAAWWRGLKGIGPKKAAQVEFWSTQHADALHLSPTLFPTASKPHHRTVDVVNSSVVPLERLTLSVTTSGAAGRNRADRRSLQIDVNDDLEAVEAWLRRCGNEGTRRVYRRHVERMILWAVIERGTAISSLTAQDCTDYRDFLAQPLPAFRWCGPRNRPRWSTDWRPFEKGLKKEAIAQSLVVLDSLFCWLTDIHYLASNPIRGLKAPTRHDTREDVLSIVTGHARSLSRGQWELVNDELDKLPHACVVLPERILVRSVEKPSAAN